MTVNTSRSQSRLSGGPASGSSSNGPNRNKSVSSHDLLVQRQQEENDLIVQRSDLARSGKLLGRPSDPEQSDSSSKPILIASKQKSTTMSSANNKNLCRGHKPCQKTPDWPDGSK